MRRHLARWRWMVIRKSIQVIPVSFLNIYWNISKRSSTQAMKMFIEASETHESEISQMFLPTDNPLFFQLKVHSEIDNVLSLTN